MFEMYKQIAEEETGYKLDNWDFVIVFVYFVLFLPLNVLIDLCKYLLGKYAEMLAYYCKFKGER